LEWSEIYLPNIDFEECTELIEVQGSENEDSVRILEVAFGSNGTQPPILGWADPEGAHSAIGKGFNFEVEEVALDPAEIGEE
jgi:hypothetical protein